jgi:hypothetical protein
MDLRFSTQTRGSNREQVYGRTKFKISGVLFNLLGLYQQEITLNIWYVLSGGNRNAEPHQDGDF